VRRAFIVVFGSALFVVLWASTAVAQTDYPPSPTAAPVRVPGAPGRLPVTGSSNTPSLILIGIAALVIGLVLVLLVRRHRALARGTI
jgi:LPXTG-motif cell wall-anchored protein